MQRQQQVDDLRAGGTIEIAGRLIGQQDGRPTGERPGHGHALLLAAGQLDGVMSHAIGEPYGLEQLRGSLAGAPIPAQFQRDGDVFHRGQRRDQME